MRILSILAGAANGGAETFFVTLAKALAEAGEESRAVIRPNLPRRADLEAGGVPVSEAPFGSWLDFRTGAALRRAIAEFSPDVVLSYMSRASAFMPDGPHLKAARLGGFYDLKYFRKCDHLICITEGIRRHVIAGGWPEDRCSVIANFAERDTSPAADRAALGVPEGATVVFTPSRLHTVKGFDVLMRAATGLPQVHLWIAGSGPEEASLKALAVELGIADRVRFLGWRRDTGAFFRSCDIVAFPSRHEPFGTVTLEAWAYGKPLVTTDADGPAEFVRDGEDGLIVPKGEAAPLREALRRVIEEPGLADRLVAAGSARHAAEFTQAACVTNYTALFRRLRGEAT
ncbi:glycosyltransferase [Thalassobaculum sp.]|uniref:glycosyltransferase n=1 Tax=Thalassobaculum sp. TaxID=2022740 RepID=UPI0032EFF594